MRPWTRLPILASLTLSLLFATVEAHEARADVRAEASTSADAIAARVQGFYDGTRTYQARFEQVYHIEAYNRKKRSAGQVTFQRPGRMNWKYDEPNGNRVVSDGQTLTIYEKDKSQVVEQPLGASQYPAVLSFLVGKGNLREMFNLRKLDEKRMNFEGGYVLEGTPKQATSAYTKVIMYIDADTAQVRRMLVIDAQRNRNLFTFSNPTVNVAVPATTFAFTAPPGTQVVRP
jgi:outer membrane lipoprotein carrier protein